MSNGGRCRRSTAHGSILILTLFAVGMFAGAFLYLSVIGSRSAETTRARTAADAAALAAATVKARTLNYEAFILLADTVLLPLGQVSQNISNAQQTFYATVCVPCISACPFCALCSPCIQYGSQQIPTTAAARPGVDRTVTEWLDGLEMMAEALDSVGPYWAEQQAVLVGTARPSYAGPESHGVTFAASFPLPDKYPQCGSLGIEMIPNTEKVQGRDACHDRAYYEYAYLFNKGNLIFTGFNTAGMGMIGKLLSTGAACDKANKVPKLGDNWKQFRYSRGMALEMDPNDDWQQAYLEALRETTPPPTLGTGWLLGMGCAEHYSQHHYGEESLWHMDWRARLVPCNYEDPANVRQVLQCGGTSAPGASMIQTQFQRQLQLDIAKHWKW
ncbi:MAG: hypothetical protein RMK29_15580 [Myxococcales bacterium]|nr:hypothetical protein [Myxococcota bacterium]MDW8283136.1 hypothetical protein [Myxococcales bacterium]